MGFRFRKSVNLGPLRFTASKSGISTSFGGKGARVTKLANGRTRSTLSVPGTGISYVSETSGKRKTSKKVIQPKSSRVVASHRKATPKSDAPLSVMVVRSVGILIICIGVLLSLAIPLIGIPVVAFGLFGIVKAHDICEEHNNAMREAPNGNEDQYLP